jgi:16S rRNA (cytidine1402-2'-O)-methyltransferase
MEKGKLYLIPTPIGNLGDMTFKSLERLKDVDLLLAEDTRKTGILLKHYEVDAKMMSYHMHNEHKVVKSLVSKLIQGENIGLVTDAGTPGISDPGFLLVREAIKGDIIVECLPGATAFVPALVQSGLPCDKFVFEGFLPVKKGRQTRFKELELETRTIVLYESPHRLLKTLREIGEYMGEGRKVAVCKEISKLYETTWRGTVKEVLEGIDEKKIKGEFVLIIGGKE